MGIVLKLFLYNFNFLIKRDLIFFLRLLTLWFRDLKDSWSFLDFFLLFSFFSFYYYALYIGLYLIYFFLNYIFLFVKILFKFYFLKNLNMDSHFRLYRFLFFFFKSWLAFENFLLTKLEFVLGILGRGLKGVLTYFILDIVLYYFLVFVFRLVFLRLLIFFLAFLKFLYRLLLICFLTWVLIFSIVFFLLVLIFSILLFLIELIFNISSCFKIFSRIRVKFNLIHIIFKNFFKNQCIKLKFKIKIMYWFFYIYCLGKW